MNEKINKPLILIMVAIVMLSSITVMIGWIIDYRPILTLIPDGPTMKFNTALCFLLTTLYIGLYKFKFNRSRILKITCGAAVFIIACMSLLSYFTGALINMDQFFISDHYNLSTPGRMSPATSTAFIVIIISLIMNASEKEQFWKYGQIPITIIIYIALTSIIAYTFGIDIDHRSFFMRTMALHTSLLFILLSIAAFVIHPKIGISWLIVGNSIGSQTIRKTLPIFLFLPCILGFGFVYLVKHQQMKPDFAITLFTTLFMGISFIYVLIIGFGQNKADRARKQLEEQLSAHNKRMKQFVYITSHDLQEPLNTINSFAKYLSKSQAWDNDHATEMSLKFLCGAADRMSIMIADLLEYSRIGNNNDKTSVSIKAIIDDIINDLSIKIMNTNTYIDIQTDLPTLIGNKTEIRLLFQNLISNAIKFKKENSSPQIQISAKNCTSYWKFTITDNGIGIDPMYQDRIFLIFQKLHNRTQYEGSGMGLAICQSIVDRHNGKIWVESEENQGSRFYFTLPKIN